MTIVLQNLYQKIRLLLRNSKERESYLRFYKILGFYPKNLEYYREAITHKSKRIYKKGHSMNNERLEFLGDAVLDVIVADIVYKHFPNKEEGFLTTVRSKVVKRQTLNEIAEKIGLDKMVQIDLHTIAHNNFLYGNAFEALIGAIYMDQGYYKCKEFFTKMILDKYIDLDDIAKKEVNFKSHLLEWCQKNKLPLSFETDQGRENGDPFFYTRVFINGMECCSGTGFTKKESHQRAAKNTLKKLKHDRDFEQKVLTWASREEVAPSAEANSQA